MKTIMKNYMVWIALLVALSFITTNIAVGQTPLNPTKDIWCENAVGGGCVNGFGLSVISESSDCNVQRVAFIGWDLSDVSQAASSAEIALTSYFVSQAPVPPEQIEFELFVPSTQDWTEGTTSSPGGSGATLATSAAVFVDGSDPQTIVFGGSANSDDAEALATYFNSLTSDTVSVGVRITDGCLVNTVVVFNDREQTGGTDVAQPELYLFTPTAVSLGSISAVGQVQNGAGVALFIAALLLLGTGTAVYYRRRQNDMP